MRTISDFIKLDEEKSGKKGPIIVSALRDLLTGSVNGRGGRAGDNLTRWEEIKGRTGLKPAVTKVVTGVMLSVEVDGGGKDIRQRLQVAAVVSCSALLVLERSEW